MVVSSIGVGGLFFLAIKNAKQVLQTFLIRIKAEMYATLLGGVLSMSEKKDNWTKQKAKSSVNKQGYTEDEADQRPTSQLEERAKKKNTKI